MPIAPQASSAAGRVDSVFLFIFVLSVAFLVLITGLLIFFAIRYNKKRHPKGKDIEGNTWLEIVWTVVPAILFISMFVFGWTNFRYMREVPRGAMEIEVTGRQWSWSFKYPNGKQTSDLLLAVDQPVKLKLRSPDVIHGFFIPAFRIKQDVVPGKENYTWFVPTQLGSFDIECTVICGVSHAVMLSKAIVVPLAEFEKWFHASEETPLPGREKASVSADEILKNTAASLLQQDACLSCHSVDGSAMVGPSLKGLYGKKRIIVGSDNKEVAVVVDDAYLRKSIKDPFAEIVKGYPPTMPENELSDGELDQIVEFIKSLK